MTHNIIEQMIFSFTVGIILSIDAFMIGMLFGVSFQNKIKTLLPSIIVGIFHFLLPITGYIIIKFMLKTISFNPKVIAISIILFLAIQLFFNNNNHSISKKLTLISYFSFALAVSIDSFFAGITIVYLEHANIFLSAIIFALISSFFTLISLNIGAEISKKLKKIPINKIASFLLILLAVLLFSDVL